MEGRRERKNERKTDRIKRLRGLNVAAPRTIKIRAASIDLHKGSNEFDGGDESRCRNKAWLSPCCLSRVRAFASCKLFKLIINVLRLQWAMKQL